MKSKDDIIVINKVIKKVELDLDYTIIYDIEYVSEREVYVYTEYVEIEEVVSTNNRFDLFSLQEVKNILNDLCCHYGSIDYILYNNAIEVKDVVIDLATDSIY